MTKFYITTAIDYPNASPHIGTAYEKIGADARARWRRLCGDDVYFLMGNDENSQKVAEKAQELGLDPLAYCDEMERKFRQAWSRLSLSFDRFIRTTEAAHHRGAREIFRRLLKRGDVYRGMYKSWYCVGCESRKTDKDLVNGKCANHPNRDLEWVEEENWFFRLTAYRDRIREVVKNTDFVEPGIRRNEVLGVLEEGLEDISISRAKTKWGVPVPDDPDHVIYVWFDALVNYITGVGFPDGPDFGRWWPCDVHVIGKDITRFHCIIWPAMLLGADLPLPKKVFAHGFVYLSGEKISKSGKRLDPAKAADRFGGDPLRYFLLREIAFDNDGDFTWEKFVERYNGELANELGNLLNRVVNMAEKNLGGVFEKPPAPLPQDAALREKLLGLADRVAPHYDRFEFHFALAQIWDAVRQANRYLDETRPWTAAKEGRRDAVAASLYNAAEALRIIAVLASPVIPATADRIGEQIGIGPLSTARLETVRAWGGVPGGTRVRRAAPLFPRLDKVPEAEEFA
ncbi:MAG: methionine--tRNA ligase [Planctomycetes bacterium]|nr:methionine--tRNA ligase [Planctomycetota bacterium]